MQPATLPTCRPHTWQGRRLRAATKQLIHVRRLTTLLNSAVQTEMKQAKQQRFNRVASLEERLRAARSARAGGVWAEGGSAGASSTAAAEQEALRVAVLAVRSVISRALSDTSTSTAAAAVDARKAAPLPAGRGAPPRYPSHLPATGGAAVDAREAAPPPAGRGAPPQFPGHLPATGVKASRGGGATAAPDEPLLSPLVVQPGEWWLSAVCCGPRPKQPPGGTAFDLPLLATLLHAYAVPARTKGGVPRGKQLRTQQAAVVR